jgi:hypothetical protein
MRQSEEQIVEGGPILSEELVGSLSLAKSVTGK